MFFHQNQFMYVFLCFFVSSYHGNNISSVRAITSEIWGWSTALFFSSKQALFFAIFGHFLVAAVFMAYSAKMDLINSNYQIEIDFSCRKSEIHILWVRCAQRGRQLHHYTSLKAELLASRPPSISANYEPFTMKFFLHRYFDVKKWSWLVISP